MAAYASSSDLSARFDETIIKDLASDSGEPVVDISSDAKVSAALDDSSGRIDAAVLVAGIYAVTDLTALTGNSLALLKRLTCELAMCDLMRRRQDPEVYEKLAFMKKDVEDYLDRLRKGERLFGAVDDAIGAGKPTIDGPTATDYQRLNIITVRTRNFYPGIASRLPIGRQG